MIPLKDDIPTRRFPLLTVSIIAADITIFFYQISLGPQVGEQLVYRFGAIPSELVQGFSVGSLFPAATTIFTSMFLHGGLWHVGGNMLYLWIFGNNVEDAMGRGRFLIFYLLCGTAAAYAHALTDPGSSVPMIGASGAISGVLGAYLLLYPRARVLTLVPFGFFFQMMRIPAAVVLLFWIVVQLLNGTLAFGQAGVGGVAWFAHVGGFFTGMALIHLFRRRRR